MRRSLPSITAIPSLRHSCARTAWPGPNAWTGQSRDHEGQALLGSQASARQSPTARRSRAADRSGERHGRSIGMRVRPHRAPCGSSLTGGSIAVRVRPPGNWLLSSDCALLFAHLQPTMVNQPLTIEDSALGGEAFAVDASMIVAD